MTDRADEIFVEKCHQLNVLLAVARDLLSELQTRSIEHTPPPTDKAVGFAYRFLQGAGYYLKEMKESLDHLIGIHYGA